MLRRCGSLALLALAALVVGACDGGGADGPAGKRVITLGFDGMDYQLTKELMTEGRMPNFSRMVEHGSFSALTTSIPPQSPVAWSNFITGMDSGGHGIFDFVHRDPDTLIPYLSTSRTQDGTSIRIGKYQLPLAGGSVQLLRRGRSFWEVLEDHGVETTILRMPANFPPSGTASRELSGMGTPDLVGTYGTFSFYTSKPFAFDGQDIGGGDVYRVQVIDGIVEANLHGPDNPYLVESEKIFAPFTVYIDPVDPLAKIVVEGEELILREGEWSDWVPVDFDLVFTQALRGMCRFYLRSVRPDFELYASPINFDPLEPALPLSTPGSYAAELAAATGRFYTQGMPEDTRSLQEGVLTTDEFLAQAEIAGREVARQYKHVLDRFEGGFLFYYFGNLDQLSHMMWHVRDPEHPFHDPEKHGRYAGLIEGLYEELDAIVGYTLDYMGGDTTLVVMSDHGFTSWRRSFHMNAWLRENGYLSVKNPDLAHDPGMFANVNWSGTRAFNVGINGVYINLRGRERYGSVPRGRREALMNEISEKLLAVIDPVTGAPAITKVYQREEVYEQRGQLEIGPDLIIGYAKGTRGSGSSALGAVRTNVLTDNLSDWSGDHSMDHETVPGILLTNRPLKKPAPRLQDLSAAILAEFGIEEPVPERVAKATE